MTIDVVIIGAGPYGLSLAAHLNARGIDFRIFGKPMESWKTSMPAGMLLKSTPLASSLFDPEGCFTVRQFCAEREAPYHDSLMALPLESYVAYGEAFQRRYVPSVEQKKLTSLSQLSHGSAPQDFVAVFDDGEVVNARRVVVAVGMHPFRHVARSVIGLPAEMLSHSGDHGPLDRFRGQRVAVLGSGASASDLAALLHEQGAAVSLVTGVPELRFACPPRLPTLWERLSDPASGIGNGWLLKACADAPWLTRLLPDSYRLRLAKMPRPLGGAFIKDRVVGRVPLLLGRTVEQAEIHNGKVHLLTARQDGAKQTLEIDHVIAATGYKVDINRIPFLDASLTTRIQRRGGAPALSMAYESSVSGLHFIGPIAANSFGPVARFVVGAIYPSRRLARELSRRLWRGSVQVSKTSGHMSPALPRVGLQ
jgi:thioredoxin reductase